MRSRGRLGSSRPVGKVSCALVTAGLVLFASCARRPVEVADPGGSVVPATATSSVASMVTDTEPPTGTTADSSLESVSQPISTPATAASGSDVADSGKTVFPCAGATSNMILDLVGDFTGQASPIEAARFFVLQSWAAPFTAPADAEWVVSGEGSPSAYLTTENLRLHVVQSATNQTWTVDEATRCAG